MYRRWELPHDRYVIEDGGHWTFYDRPGHVFFATDDPELALGRLATLLGIDEDDDKED